MQIGWGKGLALQEPTCRLSLSHHGLFSFLCGLPQEPCRVNFGQSHMRGPRTHFLKYLLFLILLVWGPPPFCALTDHSWKAPGTLCEARDPLWVGTMPGNALLTVLLLSSVFFFFIFVGVSLTCAAFLSLFVLLFLVDLKRAFWSTSTRGRGLLGVGVLGVGLGALKHSVLGQIPGQQQAHGRLDLSGCEG